MENTIESDIDNSVMQHNNQHNMEQLSLHALLEIPLQTVEDILHEEFQHSKFPMLQAIAQHIIASGGKRIRPTLCLAIAKICGNISDSVLITAAALEFIHTATLLHDDVIDNGTSRRGKQSAHMIWGNQGAILAGDHMFACAFSMLAETSNFRAIRIMSHAAKRLAEGEIIQLSLRHKVPNFDDHIRILGNKTAALFAAGCASGAVFNDAPQVAIDNAYNFGYNFGICFQLIDDILDYQGNEEIGKPLGIDFFEGKFTLPLILTYQNASQEDQKLIHQIMITQKERTNDDFNRIKDMITCSDHIQKAREIAMGYLEKSKKNLAYFEVDQPIYHVLKTMICETLYRKI